MWLVIATSHAILPGSNDSILDGVKHGGSQEQRRFSYSLKSQINQERVKKAESFWIWCNPRIFADVIYIFLNNIRLCAAMLNTNWLQTIKQLVKLNKRWNFGSLGVIFEEKLALFQKLQNFWVAKALMDSCAFCKILRFWTHVAQKYQIHRAQISNPYDLW